MKFPFRILTPLVIVAALSAACNPFVPRKPKMQLPHDPRFAEFTYETDNEPKVQERIDSFNERMPQLGAIEGHVVAANFPEGSSFLPSPDHHFWVTGVATIPDETIARLGDDSIGDGSLLPPIHPALYQYVPEGCHFATVDASFANEALGTDSNGVYSDWGSFSISEFAVSAECHLIIVTGEGVNG